MSEVDLPASKRLKTSNQNNSTKLDVDKNLKPIKEADLAPGISEMIDEAIAKNCIPLARLLPELDLSE